ncbi:MAG: endonuclease III [Corynebacterium sp.]|nr:endonuclease III [Corynebacterium sp.]
MTPSNTLRQRALEIAENLAATYPDAACELDFSTPLELTVATILSAQCTDVRVNSVTPQLFETYPDAAAYASADPEELSAIIAPTGFQNRKTSQLIKLGQALLSDHGGEIPSDMGALTALPGVGRKTANVVRANAFGLPGLTVDTHFSRLVRRWELTQETKPDRIEFAMAKLLPEREWSNFSHRTIIHGRRVCKARKPACGICVLQHCCPSVDWPVTSATLAHSQQAAKEFHA